MKGLDRYITGNYGEDQFDPPCEMCGKFEDKCVCPEYPICGEIGNPDCYNEGPVDHDMEVTLEQQIVKQEFEIACIKEQLQDAHHHLDYLKGQKERRDHPENWTF